MTGVACAYWLTEHGFKDIVIVDARGVCEGATGRNAGHLWAFTELPTSDGTNTLKTYRTTNFRALLALTSVLTLALFLSCRDPKVWP